MRGKAIFLAGAAVAIAALSVAQQLPYSSAPTDKDYRLQIKEPLDKATITGADITIVMAEPFVPTGAGANETPQRAQLTPIFQVWIDGKDYGNLPRGNNVFTAHDISYGPHKIVVVAKNPTGDVIGRKEIGVMTVAAVTTQTTLTTETTAAAPPPPVVEAPPPPPQPMTAPPPPEPAPMPSTLPQTASSYPEAAAAGLCLLAVGFALRRRV